MSQVHSDHDNPFFNRQRITDARYFCGRQRELEALYSAIATRQCRSVVGERKLGKSSLLTHLSNADTLRRHGFDPDGFVFIYADLEGMAQASYDELWPEWLDLLAAALPEAQEEIKAEVMQLAALPQVRFMRVRRLMRRLERAGLTVVILLDEFESLASNPEFGAAFYGELRSLAGDVGVVYITASKRGLFDLTYRSADTLSSPFFNIFSDVVIGLMPEEEAGELLRRTSAFPDHEPFSDTHIQQLIELAGPHPFFLNIAGYHLYALRSFEQPNERKKALLEHRFRSESEDHYQYLWRGLSAKEQSAILHVDKIGTDSAISHRLRAKALICVESNGHCRPFCTSFGDFLARIDVADLQPPFLGSRGETTNLSGITLGSYRLLSPIGSGAMAIVYKGYQPALDRYVAVKVMAHAVVENKTFVERFQREASAVARLRHHNIVQMLDFGLQDDISYMVMEYIEGETLKDRIVRLKEEGERLPLPFVLRIMADITAALDYAHAHGIIHRDVKPTNILLRSEERLAQLTGAAPFTAVLTDFGVAKMLEGVQLTGTGATIGTPDYMSPEQAQGDAATPASDIYALGIVLFEMLTGELPFTAQTPLAVLLKHLQTRPPLLASIVPELPPGLELVVMHALAKSPGDRFATAEQMYEALAHAIEVMA